MQTIKVFVVTDYNYYDSCNGTEQEAQERINELKESTEYGTVFDPNIKCHEIELLVPTP